MSKKVKNYLDFIPIKNENVKLDRHGSFVWKCIDNNKSVYELSKDVKGHFANDAEPLIERLIEFITILESNRFVKFKKGGK